MTNSPDLPMFVCLHCRWYTPKRHFCCKNLRQPVRKTAEPRLR